MALVFHRRRLRSVRHGASRRRPARPQSPIDVMNRCRPTPIPPVDARAVAVRRVGSEVRSCSRKRPHDALSAGQAQAIRQGSNMRNRDNSKPPSSTRCHRGRQALRPVDRHLKDTPIRRSRAAGAVWGLFDRTGRVRAGGNGVSRGLSSRRASSGVPGKAVHRIIFYIILIIVSVETGTSCRPGVASGDGSHEAYRGDLPKTVAAVPPRHRRLRLVAISVGRRRAQGRS